MNGWQILTAAHCTFNKSSTDIAIVPLLSYTRHFYGKPNTWKEKGYQVKHIVNHEDYNSTTWANDIALMTLTEPLDLSQYSAIDLEPFHQKSHLENESCSVAGWGLNQFGFDLLGFDRRQLSKIIVPIVNYTICNQKHEDNNDKQQNCSVTHLHICAGPPSVGSVCLE